MANIPLTPGEKYSFAVLVNQPAIIDSTDSAQATFNINNDMVLNAGGGVGAASLIITGSSTTSTSTLAKPMLHWTNNTYNNNLYIGHGRYTLTTVTNIGFRTIGNFGPHYAINPTTTVNEPYIIMSASNNGANRRVGIIAGLHTSFRQSAGTLTVSVSDHFIEHTATGNQTVTLPSALGVEAGRQLLITKLNSGGTLTVSASGTDRIVRAGAATPGRRTTQQYAFAQYFCNGNGQWYAAEEGTWAG